MLLTASGEFLYVVRDSWGESLTVPNDPKWVDGSQQPTLDRVCIQKAWSVITTATEPIAIVDSGVWNAGGNQPHPDLAANILRNLADPIDGDDDDGNG